jgi:DNA-binding NtrC family response regulator
MMSGHGTIQTALDAVRAGAYDFLEKPISVDRLFVSLRNCLDRQRLADENEQLRQEGGGRWEILGVSDAMESLRAEIARAAPTDARVLITGENGTGKELVARALHEKSPRRDRPLVKVNCAAIPAELLESELFGHEKGAFTGAVSMRRGKFELAQRGTLLLDEIGDMNPTTQAKLLRVLEERELERVGGERTIRLDVRVLASTNRDLDALMDEGHFRRDLFFRLKVVPLHVPPLREHQEDVAPLSEHFLARTCRENGRPRKELTSEALDLLSAHPWPGNVRELRNLMERLVIMVDDQVIDATHVSPLLAVSGESPGGPLAKGRPLAESLRELEVRLIREALESAEGNMAEAARRLGLDRANLHRRMKRLALHRG